MTVKTNIGEPAGVWLRVSSGGQDEETQEPEDLAWCQAHQYEVRATYTVHGKSAFKGNKAFDQAWAQVLADLESGKIKVLVVWKQDRLDRKLHTFQMLEQVMDAGGRVEFVTQPHLNDLTTMGGRIALKVQEEIAHAESKDKSDRVRIKFDALRAADSLIGRPPWGLQVTCTEACGRTGKECRHRKTLSATPEGRKYLPEVFERVTRGESLATVARWLESVTGRPWWPRTVGHMIRTATYAGYRTDAEGRTVLTVEPLVDMATWKRANEALDGRPKKGPALGHRAMLTGVIFCPRCGGDSPMYRIHGSTGACSFYYRCTGKGPQRQGCGNMVPLAQADAMVCEIAEATFKWRKVTRTVFTPGHNHEPELEAVRFELEALPKRRLPWGQEDAERARLRAEHDRLSALPATPDTWAEVETGQTYADLWAGLEPSERPAWLKAQGFRVEATRERLRLSQPGKPGQPAVEVTAGGVTFAKADLKAAA